MSEEQEILYVSENGILRQITKEEQLLITGNTDSKLIPHNISNVQLRTHLLSLNKLSTIDSAIQSNTAEDAGVVLIQWEYAVDILRSSALFQFIVSQLELDDKQEDEFLIAAAQL